MLSLVATGIHGAHAVSDIRIADATDTSTPQQDGVVVLMTLPVSRPDEILDLADKEIACGCIGVVLDAPEPPPSLVGGLVERGLTVHRRRRGAGWLQVADAVRAATHRTEPLEGELIGTIPRGDLKGFAEALGEMLGGPVTLEDVDFRVLAFSTKDAAVDTGRDTAILGGRMPEVWRAHLEREGALETLLTSDRTVDITNGPLNARRRLLKSIWDGNRPLGIMWLAEGSTSLSGDVVERLDRAARIAVPHFLHHQEETRDRRADQHRKLRRLLEPGRPLGDELDDLEMTSCHGFALLALRASAGDAAGRTTTRIVESVDLYCLSYAWRTATAAVSSTVYTLIALDGERDRAQIMALATRLAGYLQQHQQVDVAVSVAGPLPDAASIATLRSRCDAVTALQRQRADPVQRILHYRDAFPLVVLDALGETADELDPLNYYKLDRIVRHDDRRGTDYLATLATYLRDSGNVAASAERLGLHHTTLRYRMKRIEELSGLDLDDPDERLFCQFVLRRVAR
ncbi:hypothetical protein CFP66_37770 [Pseudonocardia sp. MH-G8]|nr:hypothetical protein CFP66_37770 [Pseudonocardia sp. MH-G8]